eukprot:TRINITY_DN16155_c1_g2_i2.p1 TRINITY_DN16155_c1_g2~~TRINITY_DN16155_c1_g2_i2.p1  ORF type:complete len:2253 (+),score=933.60 TRINITY_DN16155_c1_g2_i2:28-6759(+)
MDDTDWRERGKQAQSWIEKYDDSGDEWLGWLMNYDVTTVVDEASKVPQQALTLVFYGVDGRTFKGDYVVRPYFYVIPEAGCEEEVEMGVKAMFAADLAEVTRVEKEDLELPNHLSGIKRTLIRLAFFNVKQLTATRDQLMLFVKKNRSRFEAQTFNIDDLLRNTTEQSNWTESVTDLREYDVKYHVRVSIDKAIYVGKWYYVTGKDGTITVRPREEYLTMAQPRICAFDIETTKAPLKFPRPDEDQVYMISWMLDGHGFLIINREIVTRDIEDFEYTPKPEYEGIFTVFNVANEEATLRKFIELMKMQKPHVFVTYNGDFFDFPFLMRRMQEYRMSMFAELGFRDVNNETQSPYVSHLDCMCWVNRDSYLPQGSRSLKAVCKAKLGYDPLEIDPEDMLPLAIEDPQKMASYSVSDAVATYYLYMKYVHPFIYSLCTIIPMSPDEVLRKGSGTLCEQLLMVMAFEKNVICPNKKVQEKERFHNGHLLDTETYIGGHVEALQSGIFRADIPIEWNLDSAKYQELIDNAYGVMKFALEVEMGIKLETIENFDEVLASVVSKLENLRDNPKRTEVPHILHLDVGAMYPNIILTNRLQPPSMVTEETCAACCFNDPANDCKRNMKWIWRGEYFVLSKGEFDTLKGQIETEQFHTKKVEDVQKKMAGKKGFKFSKKPLFEKKKFERKKVEGYQGGGTGYRKKGDQSAMAEMLKEEEQRLLGGGGQEEAADNGVSKFGDLKDDERFALVKKRVTDYCRKAYARIHETQHIDKVTTVCQRENSFYVDTVRLFRDRRVAYKHELKTWKNNYDAVMAGESKEWSVQDCKGRLVLYESLQLAHKCILNSFYGYVMRKGSRWYSMEMAAAVTLCGASLITMSRELVDKIGLSLELDTDGIWCCLPGTFPMDVVFMTNKGRKVKVSYPCAMLNKDVEVRYENKQYQTLKSIGEYEKSTECTIFFEVDGPYRAMVLPAAKEEGKTIKKRYAVFEFDGGLAELKGFELKRRGELQLIKDFQAQIFAKDSMLLDGTTLADAYNNIGSVADMCLDILFTRGAELDDDILMNKISESSSMTRRLADYPKDQKSLATTTARRLADFLGDDMTKDAGLKCTYVIVKKPEGSPVTVRAVPIQIFQAEPKVRVYWLRRWLQDGSLGIDGDVDVRDILDWDYYITRLSGAILKIITIPAAFQKVANPNPRVPYPDWLKRVVGERDSKYKQLKIGGFVTRKPREKAPPRSADIEDLQKPKAAPVQTKRKRDDAADEPKAPPLPPKSFSKQYLTASWTTQSDTGKPVAAAASCNLWAEGILNDKSFDTWLTHAKYVWKNNGEGGGKAHRKDILAMMTAPQTLLTETWEVLEMRQVQGDPPGIVRLLALVGDTVKYLRIRVQNYVLINTKAPWSEQLIKGYKAVPSQVTLPRGIKKQHLYKIPLESATADQEADIVFTLRCDPNVVGVFEESVSSAMRCQLLLGNKCKVDTSKHSKRNSKEPDLFHAEDLVPAFPDLASKHRAQPTTKPVHALFLYHSVKDTRGVVALVMPHRNISRVVFIRQAAKGASEPSLRWDSLMEEATQETLKDTQAEDHAQKDKGHPFAEAPSSFTHDVSFVGDEQQALRLINDEIRQDLVVSRRFLVMAQCQIPKATLLAKLPDLAPTPLLMVPYNRADDNIYSHSLQWVKDMGRRIMYRYLSARPYVANLYSMSLFTGLPVGNLDGDTCVRALDMLYSRCLQAGYHGLWASKTAHPDLGTTATSDEDLAICASLEDASKPVVVQVSGSHHTWVVEFDVLHLEVVALLAEDPGNLKFTDTNITSHFHILREMVWALYNQTMQHNLSADNLMSDICRWLRSPTSLLYEPQLAVFVANLAKQLFGRLLTRLTKLGCKIIFADYTRLVLATPKNSFRECVTFTNYLLTALRDQAIFKRVTIDVANFWSEYLFLDKNNFAGMKVKELKPAPNGGVDVQGVDLEAFGNDTSVAFYWTVADKLPSSIKTRFVLFIAEYLAVLSSEKRAVVEEVTADGSQVTLASVTEKIRKRTFKRIQDKVENEWTARVLKEVHNIKIEQKETEKAKGCAKETDDAVEYTKILCHVLGQEPQLADAVRQMKTAVLQICGVTSHSAEALYKKQTDLYSLDNVMCTFCHAVSTVDLLPGGLNAPDAFRMQHVFTCSDCNQSFDKDLIESKLVDTANKLIASYHIQDYHCSNCKQPQQYDMQLRCSCGSEWAPTTATASSITNTLRLLHGISQLHDMQWLGTVTTTFLEYL